MDYQEAKRLLHPDTTKDAIWEIADKQKALKKINEVCLFACEAMQELQEYHKTGLSPKQVADTICELSATKRILGHYKKIGTLEEVRESVEKPKKGVETSLGHEKEAYVCPVCDYYLAHTYFTGDGDKDGKLKSERIEPYENNENEMTAEEAWKIAKNLFSPRLIATIKAFRIMDLIKTLEFIMIGQEINLKRPDATSILTEF